MVVFVLHPVFGRGAEPESFRRLTESERHLQRLSEKKEQILTAIKDLDFEHRAGKLSDADYEKVRADELSQVADIMARMEELGKKVTPEGERAASPPAETTPPGSPKPDETNERILEVGCPSCHKANPPHAKFCHHCGSRIQLSVPCSRCGAQLPHDAKFCTECGATVQP